MSDAWQRFRSDRKGAAGRGPRPLVSDADRRLRHIRGRDRPRCRRWPASHMGSVTATTSDLRAARGMANCARISRQALPVARSGRARVRTLEDRVGIAPAARPWSGSRPARRRLDDPDEARLRASRGAKRSARGVAARTLAPTPHRRGPNAHEHAHLSLVTDRPPRRTVPQAPHGSPQSGHARQPRVDEQLQREAHH